ncbi:hypothetical protein PM082_023982 [Marasmius tenuissimus]|nr:hypothetical protein PM082_023982 [Marasmius tenuissimus]
MMAVSTAEEKYELITRRIEEVLGGDLIKSVLIEGRAPRCYWGTAPTGRPHIGYFVPLFKIADFLRAGVEACTFVKILLADVHAFLDNLKAPLELVSHRTEYYKFTLLAIFESLGIPTSRLTFVEGSSFQLTKEYNLDNYRLCATVTEHDAKKAGAEVVKQVENPLLSGLVYPGLQALDEEYLDVDFQFGGIDQRKIFTFAELYLPRIGYAKRAHLMNAMVPGFAGPGGKMSSSDPNSKIDFLDSPKVVKEKVNAAYCQEGNVKDNGLLAFTKAVIFPISELRREQQRDSHLQAVLVNPFISIDAPEGTFLTIDRAEKFGGPIHYKSYQEMEDDFASKKIHPKDLKNGVEAAIITLLEPIGEAFRKNDEWKEVEKLAYPDPIAKAKLERKKKEKGKRRPPPPGKEKNSEARVLTP